ncbi:MAG TPA: class I adenylate-forming enzyme family protein [Caulobacteraceae bacterium]
MSVAADLAKPTTRAEAITELTAPGQPYELERIVANGAPIRAFKNAPRSLRELFADNASDKPFLVYDGERWTFAEALADAARIAQVLVRDYGVVKGDRVAISMRNFPEWILAFTAATSIGAVVVAMNALWRPDELAYGLTDSGAKVFFADQERLDRLDEVAEALPVKAIAVRPRQPHRVWPDLKDLVAGLGKVAMPAVDIDPDDPATIFYTSGSTGRPKGVVSSHRNILSALLSWELDGQVGMRVMGMTPPEPAEQPATLLAVPLFHVTGSHAVYLSSYRGQRKIVCMYKWNAQEAAAIIEAERITSFVAPAAMTGDLVRVAKQNERDLSSLVTVGGGGAPRAPEQVKQIGASFGKAMPNTGWGMTETNAIGTGIGGPAYLERPASSGRSALVLDLKIIDEAGAELPTGERGELLVRGASVFRGYWNRPEVNAEVFTDGWFRTGDVAYLDAEGFLFIVDRIKDLIIRGGENIGCGQVEAAMVLHPQVFEAAVYGVPDERLGEEVGATIHADPAINVEALKNFLGEHLARFEVPRYIRLADEPLPRTASGKILKRELRAEAVAGMKANPPT